MYGKVHPCIWLVFKSVDLTRYYLGGKKILQNMIENLFILLFFFLQLVAHLLVVVEVWIK